MTIHPLNEGEFTIGHDKVFMPFDTDRDVLNERPIGSLLVEVQPFLVVTGKDILVLDTGLGFKNSEGTLQIHANLAQFGYDPSQVTKVLMTHLHKDHAGALTWTNSAGITAPTFPNAEYCIYRPEADFALAHNGKSYHAEDIEPILQSGQVRWLEGPDGEIGDGIRYWHTGAHSPQHIVYLIEEGGEKIFFGGDEAPQLKQMKIRYVAKYDHDGKKAMQLREGWAGQGKAEGWTALFYHDIKYPFARL